MIEIDPVPKPRMTRADKWKQRDCVVRYRAFCDELRLKTRGLRIPCTGLHLIFKIAMPPSWPKSKCVEMAGKPHKQKPDVDNLIKSVFDALCEDDSYIYDIRATKLWDWKGSIEFRES